MGSASRLRNLVHEPMAQRAERRGVHAIAERRNGRPAGFLR
jgi:hypothetical protein